MQYILTSWYTVAVPTFCLMHVMSICRHDKNVTHSTHVNMLIHSSLKQVSTSITPYYRLCNQKQYLIILLPESSHKHSQTFKLSNKYVEPFVGFTSLKCWLHEHTNKFLPRETFISSSFSFLKHICHEGTDKH